MSTPAFESLNLPLEDNETIVAMQQSGFDYRILRIRTSSGEIWEINLAAEVQGWLRIEQDPPLATSPLMLTEAERTALENLVDAHNAYCALPVQHPMHLQEWTLAMHQLQRLIMSRPVARQEDWVKP